MNLLKYPTLIFILFSCIACAQKVNTPSKTDWTTHFENHPNETVTYDQGIDYWTKLSGAFDRINMIPIGKSDAGKPIHLVIMTADGKNDLTSLRHSDKPLFFINNAIHAGEPCGVDATMMLFRDIVMDKEWGKVLDKVDIVTIPFYNIGGVLNRNSTSRTNQNGPKEYGFRGNAKNLDLNRDFVKTDSENAKTFNKVFSTVDPDVFLDNHTTNGADYQYVMTLISAMREHYPKALGDFFEDKMLPFLYDKMEETKFPMVPYVNSMGRTPFEGIAHFNSLPRYSMGYASLHNSLSFTGEAHMLKPFDQRVWATYELMKQVIDFMVAHGDEIKKVRAASFEDDSKLEDYTLQWSIDRDKHVPWNFKGYEAKFKPSEVSGLERMYYDRSNPMTKEIKFYNEFKPGVTVKKPKAYIIPQAYQDVIDRLKWNNVEMEVIKEDSERDVMAYRILDHNTSNRPYEHHYLHTNVKVKAFPLRKKIYAGDVIVKVDQPAAKYILEALEPQGADSFFAWNYFDAILGQKEYFSSYVFEDEAAELLRKNPEWKAELEAKKKEDERFAKSASAQLFFIYRKSDRYEPTHMVYPVVRIE